MMMTTQISQTSMNSNNVLNHTGSIPKHTGKNVQALKEYILDNGGSIKVDITFRREYVTGQAVIAYDEELFGGIAIMSDGKFFPSFTALIDHLSQVGDKDDRRNANIVVGNSDQWGNILHNNIPIIVAVGIKTLDEVYGYNPNYNVKTQSSHRKIVAKNISIDDRSIRAAWNPEYLEMKGIVYKEFVAKYGKEMIWHDLSMLTVNEFELRYGL